MEILEKKVKRVYVEEDVMKEEWKEVGEIIDGERDLVVTDDGAIVLKRQGIEKLASYVGATWNKPEIVDTPNVNNGKGFFVLVECVFPDGTKHVGPGESTEKNTKIGANFLFMTAINRAKAIAFLRSPYMDMYDVYSDEEADNFQQQANAKTQKELQKLVDKQRQYVSLVNELTKLVALPDEDEEYPKAYVIDVWDVHRDEDYLKKLTEHQDKVIQFVAKQKLKEIEGQTETGETDIKHA